MIFEAFGVERSGTEKASKNGVAHAACFSLKS